MLDMQKTAVHQPVVEFLDRIGFTAIQAMLAAIAKL